ncbi:MAG TPA: cytochrome P450 [Nannocystaceae bacterium]|nr:cytochrome P450 [Nannocystaceae bacterium]
MLDGALPILGHLPEMYRRFPSLCARGSAAHGPLFWIHGGPGARQLMCTDASALQILKSPSMSNSFYAEGWNTLLGNTLFAFDGDEHRRVRGMLAPAFTPSRIRRSDVLRIVTETVSSHLDRWISRGHVDVIAGARDVALEVIMRIIGVPGEDLLAWRQHYTRFLLAALPSHGRFRGPIHWVACRGRSWLDTRLGLIVDRLRATEQTDTLAGAVANSRDENGALLDREIVVANLRTLVFAGHETSSSAMAWSLLHFADSPEIQRRSLAEVDGDEDLVELATRQDRLTYAEAQFRESVRMYPAVHSVIRRVTAAVDLDVGVIPAGTLLNVPFVHLLRDRARFPEPDRYDPSRWTERPRPGTIETAMFGGGQHFCLGYHIAIAEGTLFNLHLARAMHRRRVRARTAYRGPVPDPVFLPLTHPPRGLSIRFEPAS